MFSEDLRKDIHGWKGIVFAVKLSSWQVCSAVDCLVETLTAVGGRKVLSAANLDSSS